MTSFWIAFHANKISLQYVHFLLPIIIQYLNWNIFWTVYYKILSPNISTFLDCHMQSRELFMWKDTQIYNQSKRNIEQHMVSIPEVSYMWKKIRWLWRELKMHDNKPFFQNPPPPKKNLFIKTFNGFMFFYVSVFFLKMLCFCFE